MTKICDPDRISDPRDLGLTGYYKVTITYRDEDGATKTVAGPTLTAAEPRFAPFHARQWAQSHGISEDSITFVECEVITRLEVYQRSASAEI